MARVECPECGGGMKVADDLLAGRKVRCPQCEAVFRPFPENDEDDRGEDRKRVRAKASRAAPPRPTARRRKDDDADDRRDDDDERPRRRAVKKGKGPLYWVLAAFAGLAAAGSIAFALWTLMAPSKIDLDTSFDLDAKPDALFTFDPISQDQTIKVKATPSNGKIHVRVYVVKGKLPSGELELARYGAPMLQKRNLDAETTLDGKIPADHSTIVLVERVGGSKPHVKLRVTN